MCSVKIKVRCNSVNYVNPTIPDVLAKTGFDTAENEPFKIRYRSLREPSRAEVTWAASKGEGTAKVGHPALDLVLRLTQTVR